MSLKYNSGIFPPEQKELFEILSKQEWISDFYLAGGTSLALQIGHRQTIDFDFFSQKTFDHKSVIKNLKKIGTLEIFHKSEHTINASLNNIKLSFFKYEYPVLSTFIKTYKMKIAHKLDVALMKLSAISSRGSKKDFIDLHFLLKDFSLEKLFEQYKKKYGIGEANGYHLLKSIAYFEDAEHEPMPIMLIPVSWKNIKQSIINEINKGKYHGKY